MSSSLHEVWEASASRPFHPTVSQNSQAFVGAILLISGETLFIFYSTSLNIADIILALLLSSGFFLSKQNLIATVSSSSNVFQTGRSSISLFLVFLRHWPSGSFLPYTLKSPQLTRDRFGAVYMICAAGVYV